MPAMLPADPVLSDPIQVLIVNEDLDTIVTCVYHCDPHVLSRETLLI
jgi:hypothetical protein